jgi:hypothetical protein
MAQAQAMSCSLIAGARPSARFTAPRAQRTRLLAPVRAGNPFVGETNDPQKVKQRKDEKVKSRPPSPQMPILFTTPPMHPSCRNCAALMLSCTHRTILYGL